MQDHLTCEDGRKQGEGVRVY
jgi:hypothetical protein